MLVFQGASLGYEEGWVCSPLHHRFASRLGQVALCLGSPPAKPVRGTSLPPGGIEDGSAGGLERPWVCWALGRGLWLVSAESLLRLQHPNGRLLRLPLGTSACVCWVGVGSAGAARCFRFGG